MLKINGLAIPSPKEMSVEINDIDGESGRALDGSFKRDRIAVKRKISLSWGPLKLQDISIILKSVQDIFFMVTYPDPMEGSIITKTFYVGNRTAARLYGEQWNGLSMSFIEQ